MQRPNQWALVTAVAAACVAAARGPAPTDIKRLAADALAQTSGEIRLAGLEQPVEVIRDRWGVPHIYAKTVADLFFAQGFVAAQDRLWQLDIWRRTAEGKLSEILGPSAVARDSFTRLLRYRGDMEVEWQSYAPDAKQIIEAFVRGVNAGIEIARSEPGKLPIEFQLTGSEPEPWTPEIVTSRMAGYIMTRNVRTEVQRARLIRDAGRSAAADLMAAELRLPLSVPEGLDVDDVTDELLGATQVGQQPPDLSASRPEEPAKGLLLDPEALARDATAVGSNDWVVSGAHTATGRPLLANDPHRPIQLPSLRYTVHLNGPGWNVIGAGEPALPGVAAGHNDRIAFGFTIVGIDQQDLYVEHLDPADPERYLYKGAWERMRIERERVTVRGEARREIELRFTRHGPVLHMDRQRHRAYALRWVGTEPGSAGYLKSLALDTARNWSDFLKAVEGWKVPSENLVYADVDGNIGWIAAGLSPVRPNWHGLLPVPGHEGKYEWAGFVRVTDLPQVFNPASGLIATANHNILPKAYDKQLGYEWGASYRFDRIMEVLRQKNAKFSVEDFERLQYDELSVVARALCGALRQAVRESPLENAERGRAAGLLIEWNNVLSKDSAAAALYEIWLPKVTMGLVRAISPGGHHPALLVFSTTDRQSRHLEEALRILAQTGLATRSAAAEMWVDGSPRPLAPPPARAVDRPAVTRILTGPVLSEAWTEAVARMGADPAKWSWGKIHRADFQHPLARTPAEKALMSPGDVPRGGDGTTPNATGSGARQTNGASYREVIDLADWDRSTTINVPGLSGQPGSPHYSDLLPLWAADQYHPMAFSRAAVERYARDRLMLVPVRPRGSER